MPKPPEHVRHLVQRRFEQIHRDLQGRTTTGHPLIDKRFPEGLSPGTVVVLGGGPGSGKTRALLGIARRVASGGSGAALLVSRSDSRMQVVDRLPADTGRVYFGAFVTLEDEDGDELAIRIVGHDETDTAKRWISVDAPLAKALLGKSLDDEATVAAPAGQTTYVITGIQYRTPQAS